MGLILRVQVPTMRRWPLIVRVLTSGAFSVDAASLPRPVDCKTTAFVQMYDSADATNCFAAGAFNLFDPVGSTPDLICSESPCQALYRSLRDLHIPVECRLTTNKFLYRDVLAYLAQSSNCSRDHDLEPFPNLSIYDYSEQASNPLSTVQIVGIVVGSLLALGCVAAAWKYRGNRCDSTPSEAFIPSSEYTAVTANSTETHAFWEDDELLMHQLRADDIQIVRLIRTGPTTVEYLARFNKTRQIVSKQLAPNRLTPASMQAFVDEIKLVAKLDHPAIVHFVGAAWTKESDLQALFEYMPNGDLTTYLTSTRPEPPAIPTWNTIKLQIAIDIIEALVYVHSFSPPLVHRDLKARNVLLDADMRAKLSGFDTSRYKSDELTMTTGVGSSCWIAPEVLIGGGNYDERCDIYSFGIVLAEMDSHQLPFTDLLTSPRAAMSDMTILHLVSERKLRSSFQASCPEKLRALALHCVAFDATERPTAIEIAFRLRTIASAFCAM